MTELLEHTIRATAGTASVTPPESSQGMPCSVSQVVGALFFFCREILRLRASPIVLRSAAWLLPRVYADLRRPLRRRVWCVDAAEEVTVMRSERPRRSVAEIGRQEDPWRVKGVEKMELGPRECALTETTDCVAAAELKQVPNN